MFLNRIGPSSLLSLHNMNTKFLSAFAASFAICYLLIQIDSSLHSERNRSELSQWMLYRDMSNKNLHTVMLSGQIDFLQYRNLCLAACRNSLPEENPSESSVHCRSDTLTPRWLDYIRKCEIDERKCQIKVMGCRGWILA